MRDCITKSLVILVANVILLCVAAYAGLTTVDRARAPAGVQTTSLGSPADPLAIEESRDGDARVTANSYSNQFVGTLGVELDALGESPRCSLRGLTTTMADLRIGDAGEGAGVPGGTFDRSCAIEPLRGEYLSSTSFAEPVFVEDLPDRFEWGEIDSSGGQ